MNTQQRLTQHTIALLILAIILFLNGCVAPGAAPAQPASSGGQAAPAEQPAAAEPASTEPEEAPQEAPASDSAASGGEGDSGSAPAPRESTPGRSSRYEAVTAGVTDDNEQWNDYQDYLDRHGYIYAHWRDVSERYMIQVADQNGTAIHDAQVEIFANDTLVFQGRTDAGGRLYFYPLAVDSMSSMRRVREFRVVASKGYTAQSMLMPRTGNDTWQITIEDVVPHIRPQLDLFFLLDATGSMGDEIDKLKASIADVADQISNLPGTPDVRYGLIAYRDQGDTYVTRKFDFMGNLQNFQKDLASIYADGGGDDPEDLNTALHEAIHEMNWRPDNSVRMVVLIADAPPHLDYGWQRYSYATDMFEAVKMGIKLFPVAASNASDVAEFIFRQLAHFTGGKFVFLTYEDANNPSSGPGTETKHDVENYSVNTLDKLIVKLVREELAKLGQPVAAAPVEGGEDTTSRATVPTPAPARQPVNCTVNLDEGWSDCDQVGTVGAVRLLEINAFHEALLQLTLADRPGSFARARFEIRYQRASAGMSVHIGDSISNNGFGGDNGDQSNDAEVQLVDDLLSLYANDSVPSNQTMDGHRLFYEMPNVAHRNETVTLELSNNRLGINTPAGLDVVDSPYLFALAGQADSEGSPNNEIYAAFNRSITGDRTGGGVSEVVITLYPAGR